VELKDVASARWALCKLAFTVYRRASLACLAGLALPVDCVVVGQPVSALSVPAYSILSLSVVDAFDRVISEHQVKNTNINEPF